MAEEYLILHGWQNRRPDGHWQSWLADELEARGASVRYPQLPAPDAPILGDWLAALERELEGTDPASLTVVCHSLGCLLWIAHAARRAAAGIGAPIARRVVLAAPASPEVLCSIPEIAEFAPSLPRDDVAAALAAAGGGRTVVVASDDDPYCPGGAERAFASPLGLDFIEVRGGGHLTIEDGFGEFPLLYGVATG